MVFWMECSERPRKLRDSSCQALNYRIQHLCTPTRPAQLRQPDAKAGIRTDGVRQKYQPRSSSPSQMFAQCAHIQWLFDDE
jgi:hypothetical protein